MKQDMLCYEYLYQFENELGSELRGELKEFCSCGNPPCTRPDGRKGGCRRVTVEEVVRCIDFIISKLTVERLKLTAPQMYRSNRKRLIRIDKKGR